MGPLHGVRIIDMTSVLMGPLATQSMGDMGADVIKIEAPGGDLIRHIGPSRHVGMGPLFLNTNRSKRSVALDLKKPAGISVLKRLLVDADVLVYNVRPKAMTRLGLDYEAVAAINQRIIYAGLYGFGQDGPYAARPAYDDLIQGGAALPYLIARASGGEPRYVPTAMADRIVGLTAVSGILASLLARQRTGRGDRLDVPMFETMVAFVLNDHMGGLTYDPPLDQGGYARQLAPGRRPFRTRDGYICSLPADNGHWERLLRVMGRESLMRTDPRFATVASRAQHAEEVYEELCCWFEERTTAEWLKLLEDADVPVMPMHDLQSVLTDPHLVANGFFKIVDHPSEGSIRSMRMPMTWSENAAASPCHAPRLGEHSVEVLQQAGYSGAEINALVAEGVVTTCDVDAPAHNATVAE